VAINPLSKIKIGLRRAIDLRVSQRFEAERELMMEINNSLMDINTFYLGRMTAVEKLVEDLDRRVTEMSKESR
jgi:hypothetical protein